MPMAIDAIARSLAARQYRQDLGYDTNDPVPIPGYVPGGQTGSNKPPKPKNKDRWPVRYIKNVGWAIRGVIMSIPLMVFAILMWIPWTWLHICIPKLMSRNGKRKQKAKYKAGDEAARELDRHEMWAAPGSGIESRWPEGFRNRFWPFIKGRTWQHYDLLRALWRIVNRQGLQIGGVVSGLIIAVFQAEILGSDFSNPNIATFLDAYYGGPNSENPHELLTQGDSMCAYVVGTGIANWGEGKGNLAWFGAYHVGLLVVALMLVVDEFLNVRFGCFAPQWSRAGNGYTLMFLTAATVCTSPNWGWLKLKGSIRFRYVILILIFILGIYNLLRTFIVSLNLTEHTYANQTYRHRRHPIRPWREIEWSYVKHIQDFRARPDKDVSKHWSERLQLAIGDHFWQWQKIDRKDWNYGVKAKRRAQIVHMKTREEKEKERGQLNRKVFHGFPIDSWPEMTAQDKEDIRRGSTYKFGEKYFGLYNWDPFAKFKIDPSRLTKEDQAQLQMERNKLRFERMLAWWYYVRRAHSVACALGIIAIHIGLLINVCANGKFGTYRAEYSKASDSWNTNKGPLDTDCQYYSGMHMPIMVMKGTSSLKGVFAMIFWMVVWHIFMMGMALGVALVAFTNNRALGMMLPIPITLIGPRLSSNGIGCTLGFIAAGTLQLGLFQDYPPIVLWVCKFILYNAVGNCASHVFVNYHMENSRCLNTFWAYFNHRIYKYMDSYKWHEEVYDFAM